MGEVVSGGVAILLVDGLQAGQLMHDDGELVRTVLDEQALHYPLVEGLLMGIMD